MLEEMLIVQRCPIRFLHIWHGITGNNTVTPP
jgi:hypothetical protein